MNRTWLQTETQHQEKFFSSAFTQQLQWQRSNAGCPLIVEQY